MKFVNRAVVTPLEDGYRISSNFMVDGKKLVVTADTLTDAKAEFREKAMEAGVDDKGFEFSLRVNDQ